LGQLGAAAHSPERAAPPHTPRHELEGPRPDLLTRARHADDDRLTPPLVTALERLPHELHAPDALESVVRAARGELDQVRDEIALDLLRVHEVRHPEALAPRLLRRVGVHADDHPRADHPRAL